MLTSGKYKSFESRIKEVIFFEISLNPKLQNLLVEVGVRVSPLNPREQVVQLITSKMGYNFFYWETKQSIFECYDGKLRRILLDILFDVETNELSPISELLKQVCCLTKTPENVLYFAFDQWNSYPVHNCYTKELNCLGSASKWIWSWELSSKLTACISESW